MLNSLSTLTPINVYEINGLIHSYFTKEEKGVVDGQERVRERESDTHHFFLKYLLYCIA